MDYIRRKYLIYTVENDIDFFRQELIDKISNFSLNHVLAINYIIKKYHKSVLSKEIFDNANFYVFLHFIRDCETYDLILKSSFDVTLLYIKQLIKNYNIFIDYINKYKENTNDLLKDKKFMFVAKLSPYFHELIGINFNTEINPLFHIGKPITDLDVIYSKLFKETKFIQVDKVETLKLLIWIYLLKLDTGMSFEDNDNQDLYTILQQTGPVVNSMLTEEIKESIFPNSKTTSYWLFMKERIYDDKKIYTSNPAVTIYEKVLSYIYSEIKQGRVNTNMLKIIYIMDNDSEVRRIMLHLIYEIPRDILSIIDEEDETWKTYFVDFYRNKFIDNKTFTNVTRFYDDLFTVVASIDPENFNIKRDLEAIFKTDATTVKRFDDMKINTTYVSQMIYQYQDIDLLALENKKICQIYNEDTEYFIKEYNTYLYLNEENPTIINKGNLVKLADLDLSSPVVVFSIFSKSILKYYLDSNLAKIGLIVNNYKEDIILKLITVSSCLENFTNFVIYATCSDKSILQSVIRSIINNFNVSIIILFKHFLRENMYYVSEHLNNNKHLSKNEKKYILQIINGTID
ncbi:SWPV1-112 [Shearwaterpox virus]|uniref:Protein E6 homolog n=1 Tax=Shearwaterpox virus TaxID=1974596 RepID=A0A1V0QGV7_CNPV|nr:SWPV1-112 [Shearwaterpox virus]